MANVLPTCSTLFFLLCVFLECVDNGKRLLFEVGPSTSVGLQYILFIYNFMLAPFSTQTINLLRIRNKNVIRLKWVVRKTPSKVNCTVGWVPF